MAEIPLSCLITKIDSLRPDEVALMKKMDADVMSIKTVLEQLRYFQRRTDVVEENSLELEILVKDLRELAHESEDAIDEFLFHLAYQSCREGIGGRIYSLFKGFMSLMKISEAPPGPALSEGYIRRIVNHWSPRQDVYSPLQEIKPKFEDIFQKNEKFKFESHWNQIAGDNINVKTWQEDGILHDDADLVGTEEPRNKLIRLLTNNDDPELRVISVVGMGGLGKTTLVKKVYDDTKVKMHFQIHAWIIVSQIFTMEEVLRDLIQQLYIENRSLVLPDTENMNVEELKRQIHYLLNKNRYLIVLDDVWSVDAWISIKIAFSGNQRGSRVMLTTRNADVAFATGDSRHHIYNLQPLSEEDSWTLFCIKTFKNGHCPDNLLKESKAILKKCGGLPLAIVAITGVLIMKGQAELNWRKVDGSLGAELEDNRKLRSTYKILSLSYNDLPHYLKSCFLYMSIFPQDHLVERLKLIRLWMAEGFLEGTDEKSMEEVGESYLTELLSRNLVQVAEKATDGRIKTCRVHDLLRDIILVKSRDQNFVFTAKNGAQFPENVRRVSLQNNLSDMQQNQNFRHLRSLCMFEVKEPLTSSSIPALFSGGFKLLTVLDLQGATLTKFPSAIVELLNLRYLSLKGTKVKTIPNNIGILQKLQTLDLKQTLICKLPNEILKLQQLRNLLVYQYEFETYTDFPSSHGFKAPRGIRSLSSLRKLCSVEGGQGCKIILRELEMLTQLRRLGIIELSEENGPLLCSSLEMLTNLHALSITSSKDEILDLQCLKRPPKQLRRLYMTGRLECLPVWLSTLTNLAKIFLKSSRLQGDEDPLKTFEDLPNLIHVEFLQVYTGASLTFRAGKFKKLRILGLHEFESLETVKMEETTLPSLKRLVFKSCDRLKIIPLGINHLLKLKVLNLVTMPLELISAVQLFPTKGAECDKVQHIPEVNRIDMVDGFWETRRLNVINLEGTNPIKRPSEDPMKSHEAIKKK